LQDYLTMRDHDEDLHAVDLGCCFIHWADAWVWAADNSVDEVVLDISPFVQMHFILLQPMQTHLSSCQNTSYMMLTTSHTITLTTSRCKDHVRSIIKEIFTISLSLSLFFLCIHTHTRARAHTHTHTRAHIYT